MQPNTKTTAADPTTDRPTGTVDPATTPDVTPAVEKNPTTPEQAAAEAALRAAADALLDAARALDVAYSDPGDADRQPLAGPWALVALARSAAARALDAGDLRLVTRPHAAPLRRRPAAPTGRPVTAEAGPLGVYVVGGRGINPEAPFVSCPVDPAVLALGADDLRDRARDCELENADDLWHDRFADLVAGAALATLDLPHAIGAAE